MKKYTGMIYNNTVKIHGKAPGLLFVEAAHD